MKINKNLMSINHTAKKRSKSDIQFIVFHYVGALGDAKANTDYYKSTYVGASADFWVGFEGDIWQGNDYWNYYSWHCGGGLQGSGGASFYKVCTNANSVGIEMCVKKRSTATMNATDKDWYFTDKTIKKAAKLGAYLMKELNVDIDHVIRHYDVNGKICPNPFVYDTGDVSWKEFKSKIMSYYNGTEYEPDEDDGDDATSYYRVGTDWKDGKCINQIGAYTSLENAKNAANNASLSASYKVFNDKGKVVYEASERPLDKLTANNLKGLSEADKIKTVAPIYQQCQKDTGMLASVGLAQFCLESGYGTTDLALNANNMHGMKYSLSGNTWASSTWDGKSKYTKRTAEQDPNGNVYYVTAAFRKYPCIKDSVYDRAAYFIGAKNGNELRYPGIASITDYKKQIKAIKNGGYATDVNYINKLIDLVERWNLDKYDIKQSGDNGSNQKPPSNGSGNSDTSNDKQYIVQVGVYTSETNAKNICTRLKNSGFDACVKHENGMYIVQSGVYSVKANADKQTSALKSAGFDAIIKESDDFTAATISYTVQCGVFSSKKNAQALVDKLKNSGFDALSKSENGNYIVQAGVYESKANADKLVKKLKKKGFDAIVK